MSVDKMSVDEMSVDEMSVDEMSVDEMSVDEMSVDELSKHHGYMQENALRKLKPFVAHGTDNFSDQNFGTLGRDPTRNFRKKMACQKFSGSQNWAQIFFMFFFRKIRQNVSQKRFQR
jgi:hypothetical protein